MGLATNVLSRALGRLLGPAAILGAALLSLSGSPGLTAPAAPAVTRIGLSAPLTGPEAGFGLGLRQGAEQAVADLNRTGPRRYALVMADDAGDPKQAAAVARRLVGEGVRLVVGPLESAGVAAAAGVYEAGGAVLVTPGATYPPLTGRGLWNLFRLGPSDAQQAAAAATWIADTFAGRPVALLHDRSTFGRTLADEVARVLKARGVPEALFEGFARGERDLGGLARAVKAAGAEAVYFGGLAPEAAALARALREAGSGATLVASDGILAPDFAGAAGPAGEGTVMTMTPEPRRLPEARGARPAPRTLEAEATAALGYAAVELLAQAVERAGSAEGRRVAEALHAEPPFRTLLGAVAFDARGDTRRPDVVLRVWRRTPDGRLDYAGNEP